MGHGLVSVKKWFISGLYIPNHSWIMVHNIKPLMNQLTKPMAQSKLLGGRPFCLLQDLTGNSDAKKVKWTDVNGENWPHMARMEGGNQDKKSKHHRIGENWKHLFPWKPQIVIIFCLEYPGTEHWPIMPVMQDCHAVLSILSHVLMMSDLDDLG